MQNYTGITSHITALATARDTLTAVSSHQDGSLMVWNLNSKTPTQQFLLQGKRITAVAITPDGSRIIYSNSAVPDLFTRMIDAKSGRKLAEQLTGCIPGDVVLSPDLSYFLATCSNGIFQKDLQNWNNLGSTLDPPGIQSALAIAQDGRLSISASLDGTISVWNMGQLDSETINFDVDALNAIAISPDSKYLLLSDASRNGHEQPALWDIAGQKMVRTYLGFEAAVSPGAAAISPDNRFVSVSGMVSETGAPRVMVWDKDTGDLICRSEGLTENGRALAFSPDSQYLLVGSQVPNGTAGRLILYETRNCNIVQEFDTQEEVSSVRINADGTRALTGSSLLGRTVLWDMATGKEIRRFSSPNSNTILTAVFGPGETTILGSGISELYLWDVQTGNLLRRFTGNPAIPWMVAISPDGRYVLSGNINGDVVLWDFATGEMLNQKNIKNVVFSLTFSPDSKTAYAASTDGKLLEWHIAEKSLAELMSWIESNRYLRELTAEEKVQYLVEP